MLTYFVDTGYFIWLLCVLKSSPFFFFFEICWLLWKQCCFGFGWSSIHECGIKSFMKWVNIYSGWAYMEPDVMVVMITHAEWIYTFIVIFLVCLNVCHLAWNTLSFPLWFGFCHLKTNTQYHQSKVELLRIVWAPQAVDILRGRLPFRSRVLGIPVSILHQNPLGSFIPCLLESVQIFRHVASRSASTPRLCLCQWGSALIKTSCISGPLNERRVRY